MTPAPLLLAGCLGAASAAALGAPDAPSVSSAAPAARPVPPPENPWSLSYGWDRRGARHARLDYRLRWSLDDLREAPRELGERPSRAAEQALRGLLQGARLELYGMRVRPFRDLPLLPREDSRAPASTAAAGGAAAAAPAPKRRLYSLPRLYEGLEDSARRETERFLIREGFDLALPGHKDAPFSQKRALGEGLLDLGREGLGER